MTTNAVINMSEALTPASAAQTVFANNHGANVIPVFNGQISLPAESNPGTWPAMWQAPFMFTTPFPFTAPAGGSLVIDIDQSGNSATTSWYLEATSPDRGTRVSNPSAQSSCRFSNGNYNNSISHLNPVRGGQWYVQYNNVLPSTFGFAAIGASGVGGFWNGIPLPIDLGIFGAMGCSWSVSADITIPISSDSSGRAAWPRVNVPDTSAAVGASFYDHAALVDAAANAFGIVTTWSSKWTIGSGLGAPAAMVYATGNNAGNASGTRLIGTVATVQLNP